jgi:uncharacterized caspase-like protein
MIRTAASIEQKPAIEVVGDGVPSDELLDALAELLLQAVEAEEREQDQADDRRRLEVARARRARG